jgi:DNA-binding GntR family transcriptional regulator
MSDLQSFLGQDRNQTKSVTDFAYSELMSAILAGHIKPGDTLNQEEIAKSLGASRVPVREALKQLEGEGLVIQRPRRGYVVASLNADAVEDVFDVRMVLEERAGLLATQRRTEKDVVAVQTLLTIMDEYQIDGSYDHQVWGEMNRQFHDRLFVCCGRPHLLRAMNMQRNLVSLYVRIGGQIAPDMTRVRQEHWDIVAAFRRGEPEEVATLSRHHVQRTAEALVAKLREIPIEKATAA